MHWPVFVASLLGHTRAAWSDGFAPCFTFRDTGFSVPWLMILCAKDGQ